MHEHGEKRNKQQGTAKSKQINFRGGLFTSGEKKKQVFPSHFNPQVSLSPEQVLYHPVHSAPRPNVTFLPKHGRGMDEPSKL